MLIKWQPNLKHLMYTVHTFNERQQRRQPNLKHLMYSVNTFNERQQPNLKHLMYTVHTSVTTNIQNNYVCKISTSYQSGKYRHTFMLIKWQLNLKHLMYTVHTFNERRQPNFKHLMYSVHTFNDWQQWRQPTLKHLMYTVHTFNERWQPNFKHLMYSVYTSVTTNIQKKLCVYNFYQLPNWQPQTYINGNQI